MYHTSHITYWIWICMFYKIILIIIVVPFNNSIKLILKKFSNVFWWKSSHWQNERLCLVNKFVKSSISRWKESLLEKLGFPNKSWNRKILVIIFESDQTKFKWLNSENITSSVFLIRSAWCFLFFLLIYNFSITFGEIHMAYCVIIVKIFNMSIF